MSWPSRPGTRPRYQQTANSSHSSLMSITSNAAASTSTASVTPALLLSASLCPNPDSVRNGHRFHSNAVCNIHEFNEYKNVHVNRYSNIQRLSQLGTVQHIPNEKTSYCPMNEDSTAMSSTDSMNTGLDTMWMVENKASTPILLTHVNAQGMEVSAMDGSDIQNMLSSGDDTKPAAIQSSLDIEGNKNILQPGQWMALRTFEGHVFQARQVLADGSVGRILLTHRVGLVPIGSNFDAANAVSCPLIDIPPHHNGKFDAAFDRSRPPVNRPCNTVDIGFRNMAGCPVSGYYVQTNGDSCTEQFKFHLGTQSIHLQDFYEGWTSNVKYEGTSIGHSFHFRLTHDPSILVDRITIQPTIVEDCPDEQRKVSAAAFNIQGEAVGIASSMGDAAYQQALADAMGVGGAHSEGLLEERN